ncbi:hypothetical protein BKI52_08635 [marine bacterium AO1-C]|nr:hypothetical protein BKI52_08635 [marine bacterium AO1-C]
MNYTKKPIISIHYIFLFLFSLVFVTTKAQNVVDLSNQQISYGDDFFELVGMSQDENKVILPKLSCKFSEFTNGLKANWLKFGGQVIFEDGTFQKACKFGMVEFHNQVSFARMLFEHKASFYGCAFQKKVDFSGAVFKDNLNLSNAKLMAECDFTSAELPPDIDFSNVDLSQCKDTIDFTRAIYKANGPLRINLVSTDIYKIKLDYANFELDFGQATEDAKTEVYQRLLFMQTQLGFTEGYKKLEQEYNYFIGKEKKSVSNSNDASYSYQSVDNTGKIFIMIVLGLILSVSLALFRFSNSKTSIHVSKKASATAKSSIKSFVKPSNQIPLNYFKNEAVPIEKMKQKEQDSKALWLTYQVPFNGLDDSEIFWEQYERLLKR